MSIHTSFRGKGTFRGKYNPFPPPKGSGPPPQVIPLQANGPQPIRFSISSQNPVFVPSHRIITHTTETAEFVSTGD